LKPAKILAKQVCGDKAKKNRKGKSNKCYNAVVTVKTQEDGPLEEEKEPMTLQVPTLEDALSIIGSADTASC
jgi:hypothetical protein